MQSMNMKQWLKLCDNQKITKFVSDIDDDNRIYAVSDDMMKMYGYIWYGDEEKYFMFNKNGLNFDRRNRVFNDVQFVS